ncbi:MAG: DMT family transporter [Planctomycetes bacterium]|nr:DMT family transporter [Planctomycetota bacterium]
MRGTSTSGLPLLAISITTLIWAGNFSAAKFATDELNPLLISSIRIFAGALFFPLFLPAADRRRLARLSLWKTILPLALTGIFLNQICFAAGMKWTTPGHSVIVHALIPVFVLSIAWIFLREGAGRLTLLGVALAIGGVVYLGVSGPEEEVRRTLAGDAVTLAGAIAFSAYVVLGRWVIPAVGSYQAVTYSFVMAAPLALPLFLIAAAHQDWTRVTLRGWAGLAYMVLGATFICYALHMWSLAHLGPLRVAVFTNLQPILAVPIAQLFGQERLTWTFAAAAAVVMAGVAIVQFAPARRAVSAPAPEASLSGRRGST